MSRLRVAAFMLLPVLGTACNLFDSSQVPVVTVGRGPRPDIFLDAVTRVSPHGVPR